MRKIALLLLALTASAPTRLVGEELSTACDREKRLCVRSSFHVMVQDRQVGPDFDVYAISANGVRIASAYVGRHPDFPLCKECKVARVSKVENRAYARMGGLAQERLISINAGMYLHVFLRSPSGGLSGATRSMMSRARFSVALSEREKH